MSLYYRVLQREGGIAQVHKLEELGISRHAQRQLLVAGKLIRPQRGWLALPGLDPDFMFAARHGVLLTCMTVAHRAGLWTTKKPGLHVAARRTNASHGRLGEVTHWGAPVMRRAPHALIDTLENALSYIAGCQPREEAHAVWESALRKGLVEREVLARLPLGPQALELLEECTAFSDSGLESFVLRRLRALRLHVVPQAWMAGHRVDFLVEGWLVLQVDGSQHEGEQRDEDNEHDTLLESMGYVVQRLTYRRVMFNWPEAQRVVMVRLSQGRPLARR